MAAQVELGREDYEHAIARVFFKNESGERSVVGTGFLVAPGYVLTCAHVVLQAMGINEDDFADYQQPPQGTVILDFLPNDYEIEAEVVNSAWQPYSGTETGDIAALKLKSSAPERAKPVPVLRCSIQEIENEDHSVYGFASVSGDRSDAYKPKTNAAGGRFQFHKKDDPQDDTIEPGFSGAPVWNDERKCVVGMIATAWVPKAAEQRSKAYAIPEEKLNPILQDIFARSLWDLIEQGLNEAGSRVRNALEMAFWLCDDGHRPGDNGLLDRLRYLTELPNRGWQQDGRDVDRLTQFAVFLTVMDGLPNQLSEGLEAWVKFRRFNFETLYVQANRYRQERQVSSVYAPEHLIVLIKPDEQGNSSNVRIWLWVVGNRDSYDPLEPPLPRIENHAVPFAELPAFLDSWLEAAFDLEDPMLHCFVGRRLLGCDLDAQEIQDGLTLGNQYKLVMRTDLSQAPGEQYTVLGKKKWEALEHQGQSPARDVFVRSDCSNKGRLLKQLRSAEMAILENLSNDRVEDVFRFLAKKVGLPVALWSRQDAQCQDLEHLLDCTVLDLPNRVFEERSETLDCEETTHVGYHLSLVWEDCKVIPPTMVMPLDQEAC